MKKLLILLFTFFTLNSTAQNWYINCDFETGGWNGFQVSVPVPVVNYFNVGIQAGNGPSEVGTKSMYATYQNIYQYWNNYYSETVVEYKQINAITDMNQFYIQFDIKVHGDDDDYGAIYASNNPTDNSQWIKISPKYYNKNTWQTITLLMPNPCVFNGQIKYIGFGWHCNGLGIDNPPVAYDNIKVYTMGSPLGLDTLRDTIPDTYKSPEDNPFLCLYNLLGQKIREPEGYYIEVRKYSRKICYK